MPARCSGSRRSPGPDRSQASRGCVREREQVRRVLRAANAGSWKWNIENQTGRRLRELPATARASGRRHESPLGEWLSLFHEDDRQQVLRILHDERHESLNSQVRMRNTQGDYIWFFCTRLVQGARQRALATGGCQRRHRHGEARGRAGAPRRAKAARGDSAQGRVPCDARARAPQSARADPRGRQKWLRRSNVQDERCAQGKRRRWPASATISPSLVDDLLDVSRVTRGVIELR
jgi:hypothetical protein